MYLRSSGHSAQQTLQPHPNGRHLRRRLRQPMQLRHHLKPQLILGPLGGSPPAATGGRPVPNSCQKIRLLLDRLAQVPLLRGQVPDHRHRRAAHAGMLRICVLQLRSTKTLFDSQVADEYAVKTNRTKRLRKFTDSKEASEKISYPWLL